MGKLTNELIKLLDLTTPLENYLEENPNLSGSLMNLTNEVITKNEKGDEEANLDLVRSLYILQDEVFRYPLDREVWNHEHPLIYNIRYKLINSWEKGWVSESELNLEELPIEPREFARWLRKYSENHRLFEHPIISYLDKSNFEEFKALFYYVDMLDCPQNEIYARATVGLPDEAPRIEISKNYWDEMGTGVKSQCHGIWAERFIMNLDLIEEDFDRIDHLYDLPAKCIERFLITQYVSLYRKNWLKSIGHLGSTEIYDPKFNVFLIELGRRYGFDDRTLEYFIQHVKVDAIHSADWLKKVVMPLVEEDPSIRFEIARGAELNLKVLCRSLDGLLNLFEANNHKFSLVKS